MLTAKDIMTSEVITVSPHMPVKDLADLLWKNRISGAPVVDEAGNLLSVVTESDLIDQNKRLHIPTAISILDSVIFLENPDKSQAEIKKMAGTKVGDICAPKLVTVKADTPLDEIASIMSERKIHTLPVVAGKRLIGVIGKSDIIRILTR